MYRRSYVDHSGASGTRTGELRHCLIAHSSSLAKCGNVETNQSNTGFAHFARPHNVAASGREQGRFGVQKGSIKKQAGVPFPDVCMCLSAVWMLTDTCPSSGGTFVVPFSHRDYRNPFGPEDGVTRSAPIPGELQITAPAGSVYLQDTRTWHSSTLHNSSGSDRIAMVCRYAPWWLSVQWVTVSPSRSGFVMSRLITSR